VLLNRKSDIINKLIFLAKVISPGVII